MILTRQQLHHRVLRLASDDYVDIYPKGDTPYWLNEYTILKQAKLVSDKKKLIIRDNAHKNYTPSNLQALYSSIDIHKKTKFKRGKSAPPIGEGK